MEENRLYSTRERMALYGLVSGAALIVSGLLYTGFDDNLNRAKWISSTSVGTGLVTMVVSAMYSCGDRNRR